MTALRKEGTIKEDKGETEERKERVTSPPQILKNHQHSTQKRHIWLKRLQRRPKEATYVLLDAIFFKEYISSESIKNKAHHDTEH